MSELFSTIVSPKARRKLGHASTISGLALLIPIEGLLIPPSAYIYDRRLTEEIESPYVFGHRAFGASRPLPVSDGRQRLPRVIRETTNFILLGENIKAEGLFRIPSHKLSNDVLKEAYDRGQKFILWKEMGTVYTWPELQPGEYAENEGYSVHTAAGLIKTWYRELREPLFPCRAYNEITYTFGSNAEPSLQQLTELFSPNSPSSCLSQISRQIICKHLFPLHSLIAKHQDDNMMSPTNLAVCIAPGLLNGPDPMEDMKVGAILRELLAVAIEQWEPALREACGEQADDFEKSLRSPKMEADYEDPIEVDRPSRVPTWTKFSSKNSQQQGIVLQDNEEEPEPPQLPPRPQMRPVAQVNEDEQYSAPALPTPQQTGLSTEPETSGAPLYTDYKERFEPSNTPESSPSYESIIIAALQRKQTAQEQRAAPSDVRDASPAYESTTGANSRRLTTDYEPATGSSSPSDTSPAYQLYTGADLQRTPDDHEVRTKSSSIPESTPVYESSTDNAIRRNPTEVGQRSLSSTLPEPSPSYQGVPEAVVRRKPTNPIQSNRVTSAPEPSVRRKPIAPPTAPPPRYSLVMAGRQNTVDNLTRLFEERAQGAKVLVEAGKGERRD
jgi:Rho GTPase-activating protein 1